MSSKIKIAVIGGGLIGPRHAACVLGSPETTLITLIDPARHGAQLAADLNTNHYLTVTALLASPTNPTPSSSAPETTRTSPSLSSWSATACTWSSKKPLSTDISSSASLITLADNAGVKLLVGHHRRFNPYVVDTKAAIDSGLLGAITAITGLWTTFKPASYFAPLTDWRRVADTAGVVLINLVHEVDILHHIFGPIVRVHAELTPSAAATMPRARR